MRDSFILLAPPFADPFPATSGHLSRSCGAAAAGLKPAPIRLRQAGRPRTTSPAVSCARPGPSPLVAYPRAARPPGQARRYPTDGSVRRRVLRRVMRDTRPPTHLRQSKARIAACECVGSVHSAGAKGVQPGIRGSGQIGIWVAGQEALAASSSMSELPVGHRTARRLARTSRNACHAGSRSGYLSWSSSLKRRKAPWMARASLRAARSSPGCFTSIAETVAAARGRACG